MKHLSSLGVLLLIVLILGGVPLILQRAFPLHYPELIDQAAERYDLDPMLIRAMIYVESSYRPQAVSPKGAVGLMQILPETATWLGATEIKAEDLVDPSVNIDLGSEYLRYLLDRFPTESSALAAYNAGPTNARRWLDEEMWDGSYERTGHIPYPETKSYVRKVTMLRRLYQILH